MDDAAEDVTASYRAAGVSADRVGDWLGELQATVGFSDLIAATDLKGFPAACRRFGVALAKPPARRAPART